ncbi:MAG TPA: GtrA family protein [Xanthobacteraceae bacterium]|nr:GtrA family protein [Xanthobacteraceae bacterium]
MNAIQQIVRRALSPWQGTLALKAMTFACIGVVNTLVDFSVFFLSLQTLTSIGFSQDSKGTLIAANLTSWIFSVTCSYVLNSFITFARESGRKLAVRSYAVFVLSGVAAVVANTATLLLVAQYAPVLVAKACSILASFVVNFSMSNFVVFRARRPKHPAGAEDPVAEREPA